MGVRKAVFPVAGLGTRFLPATKASPKEMLPLVDRPIIQHVVEEATQSGITDIIFVTGRGKTVIEDHFDTAFELEHALEEKGKKKILGRIQEIPQLANFSSLRQGKALGLGHAILCAKRLVGDEPFAVLLGDDIIHSPVPCIQQLITAFEEHGEPVVAVERVPGAAIQNYGAIEARKIAERTYRITNLVEKPEPSEAPSDLAVIGRYVLTPSIFAYLEFTPPGRGGEIQLTDALRKMAHDTPLLGHLFEGTRYDSGNKLGFLKATVEYALRDPELGESFRSYLGALKI